MLVCDRCGKQVEKGSVDEIKYGMDFDFCEDCFIEYKNTIINFCKYKYKPKKPYKLGDKND